MNEIEQRFYDAYCKYHHAENLKPMVQVGPYVVDFLFHRRLVVEIDGHEFHKTKEQRFADYSRERYIMKQALFLIRFMASEVFIDPRNCVSEMIEIYQAYGVQEVYMHRLYSERELSPGGRG